MQTYEIQRKHKYSKYFVLQEAALSRGPAALHHLHPSPHIRGPLREALRGHCPKLSPVHKQSKEKRTCAIKYDSRFKYILISYSLHTLRNHLIM